MTLPPAEVARLLRGVVRTVLLLVIYYGVQVVVLTTADGAGPLAQVWGRLGG